jgi:hypothetical protein
VGVKHRLKVLRPDDDPDEPPRPTWQWVGFGVVAIFAAWVPLSVVTQGIAARFVLARLGEVDSAAGTAARLAALPEAEQWRMGMLLFVLSTTTLALAAAGGGFLVGRYGESAGVREAALSGAVAVAIAALMTAVSGGASLLSLAGLVVAVPVAAVGARLGLRLRPRGLA